MKICACGCGQQSRPYYWRGKIKGYLKYAEGHVPKHPVTPAALEILRKGRELVWTDPELRKKRNALSSETMRRTNLRRKSGEFPEWTERMMASASVSISERWRSGEQRKYMAIRADGFRSGLERHFADYLTANKVEWRYESKAFSLVIDGIVRSYAPDFYLPSLDWWIETKGLFWDADAKRRVELFAEQYPELKYSVLDRKLSPILGRKWDELPVPWVEYNSNNHVSSMLLDQDGNEIVVKRHFNKITHCKRGHEFKEGSFKMLPGNRRDCIECSRLRAREGARKRRALLKLAKAA